MEYCKVCIINTYQTVQCTFHEQTILTFSEQSQIGSFICLASVLYYCGSVVYIIMDVSIMSTVDYSLQMTVGTKLDQFSTSQCISNPNEFNLNLECNRKSTFLYQCGRQWSTLKHQNSNLRIVLPKSHLKSHVSLSNKTCCITKKITRNIHLVMVY